MRLYAEMEDQKSLRAVKDRLYEYVTREKDGAELRHLLLRLALAATFRNEHSQALEYLEKAGARTRGRFQRRYVLCDSRTRFGLSQSRSHRRFAQRNLQSTCCFSRFWIFRILKSRRKF